MNKIFLLWADSESCDHYGPWVFDKKLTSKQIEKFLRKECEQEFTEDNDGPGDFGSYLYIQTLETEIIKMK